MLWLSAASLPTTFATWSMPPDSWPIEATTSPTTAPPSLLSVSDSCAAWAAPSTVRATSCAVAAISVIAVATWSVSPRSCCILPCVLVQLCDSCVPAAANSEAVSRTPSTSSSRVVTNWLNDFASLAISSLPCTGRRCARSPSPAAMFFMAVATAASGIPSRSTKKAQRPARIRTPTTASTAHWVGPVSLRVLHRPCDRLAGARVLVPDGADGGLQAAAEGVGLLAEDILHLGAALLDQRVKPVLHVGDRAVHVLRRDAEPDRAELLALEADFLADVLDAGILGRRGDDPLDRRAFLGLLEQGLDLGLLPVHVLRERLVLPEEHGVDDEGVRVRPFGVANEVGVLAGKDRLRRDPREQLGERLGALAKRRAQRRLRRADFGGQPLAQAAHQRLAGRLLHLPHGRVDLLQVAREAGLQLGLPVGEALRHRGLESLETVPGEQHRHRRQRRDGNDSGRDHPAEQRAPAVRP